MLTEIQIRNDSDLDQGDEKGGSEKWSDSVPVWEGKSIGFPNKLDMEWERKRTEDDSQIWGWAVRRMQAPLVKWGRLQVEEV